MADGFRPHLVTLIGLPAVGKSFLAAEYRARGYEVISGDEAIEVVRLKYKLGTMDEAYRLHRDEVIANMDEQLSNAISQKKNIVSDAFLLTPFI